MSEKHFLSYSQIAFFSNQYYPGRIIKLSKKRLIAKYMFKRLKFLCLPKDYFKYKRGISECKISQKKLLFKNTFFVFCCVTIKLIFLHKIKGK